MKKNLYAPQRHGRGTCERDFRVIVLGGGLAGVGAATPLVERGVQVEIVESEPFLGGRVGAWDDRLEDGTPFQMERGFHAFFRQYYNLRSWLKRIDPELSFLTPLGDYPLLGPDGQTESFAGLPKQAPWNVIQLIRRTRTLRLRDLAKVRVSQALAMASFEQATTYDQFDEINARDYLDSLNFPPEARRMLFDVFAHSFFNPEEDMSAGELLLMFHFYFMGNPEGLIFDVLDRPFSTAIWEPMRHYLEEKGATFSLDERALSISRNGERYGVKTSRRDLEADAVILALPVGPLKSIVEHSDDLDDPGFRASIDSLQQTEPFVVHRLWLDSPLPERHHPFVGTTGVGELDNISLYHLIEDESREWARRHGGSVVELHGYAVRETDPHALRRNLLESFYTFYPEARSAGLREERFFIRQDCPSFTPGSWALRPTVTSPHRNLFLAGDFAKLPIPCALMERALTSGFMAANQILSTLDLQTEPIESVPLRGLLKSRSRRLSSPQTALVGSS